MKKIFPKQLYNSINKNFANYNNQNVKKYNETASISDRDNFMYSDNKTSESDFYKSAEEFNNKDNSCDFNYNIKPKYSDYFLDLITSSDAQRRLLSKGYSAPNGGVGNMNVKCNISDKNWHEKGDLSYLNTVNGVSNGSDFMLLKNFKLINNVLENKAHNKINVSDVKTQWRRKRRRKRRKRNIGSSNSNSPIHVETAVFVDRDLVRHMVNNFPTDTERELVRFVLAMVNAVSKIFVIL